MTQYAKYIDENNVRFCPKNLRETNFVAFNFDKASDEVLRSKGYYPIVELNTREEVEDETHFAKPQYALIENAEGNYITCTYVAEELVADESDE